MCSARCPYPYRQLNLDVLRGDVDVNVDTEPLGESNQRFYARVVIPRFHSGDGWLQHLQLPGQGGL